MKMKRIVVFMGVAAVAATFALVISGCVSVGSAASSEKRTDNSPFEGVWVQETDVEIVRYAFSGSGYSFDRNGVPVEKGTFTYTDTAITTQIKNVYLGDSWFGVDGLDPYTMNYQLTENNLTLEGNERRVLTKQ
jgi:PBP1b-binding outer membrane lipoprotein LpoB